MSSRRLRTRSGKRNFYTGTCQDFHRTRADDGTATKQLHLVFAGRQCSCLIAPRRVRVNGALETGLRTFDSDGCPYAGITEHGARRIRLRPGRRADDSH